MIPFYIAFAEPGHDDKPSRLDISHFIANLKSELLLKLVEVVFERSYNWFIDSKSRVRFKATIEVIKRMMYSEKNMLNKPFSCWYVSDSGWVELEYEEEEFMKLYNLMIDNKNNNCYLCGNKGHCEADCLEH